MAKHPFRSEMMQCMLNSRHRSLRVLGWIVAPLPLMGKVVAPGTIFLLPVAAAYRFRADMGWRIFAGALSSALFIALGVLATRRIIFFARHYQFYSLDDILLLAGCVLGLPLLLVFVLLQK